MQEEAALGGRYEQQVQSRIDVEISRRKRRDGGRQGRVGDLLANPVQQPVGVMIIIMHAMQRSNGPRFNDVEVRYGSLELAKLGVAHREAGVRRERQQFAEARNDIIQLIMT